MTSTVFVENISVTTVIGNDCWGRRKPQQALVSVRVPFDISSAAKTDSIDHALDYRKINNAVKLTEQKLFDNVIQFVDAVGKSLFNALPATIRTINLIVTLPKAILHASGGLVIQCPVARVDSAGTHCLRQDLFHTIKDMGIPCIIGIGDHERIHKQPVLVTVVIKNNPLLESIPVGDLIYKLVEASTFLTLEAMVLRIVKDISALLKNGHVTIKAQKPSVFSTADGPGIEITRVFSKPIE